MPDTEEMPRTLTAALAEYQLPPSAYEPYQAHKRVTARLLGVEPNFYPIISLSSHAIRSYTGLITRMLHAPSVDLRLSGMPSPALRRAAILAAMQSIDCPYCSAHCCAMGDLVSGSVPSQVRRGRDLSTEPLLHGEKQIVEFATAAVQRPVTETLRAKLPPLMKDVVDSTGHIGLDVTNSLISFAGFLSTVMNMLGVTLEVEAQKFALKYMDATGDVPWQVGDYHLNNSEEASADFGGADEKISGLYGKLTNVMDLVGTIPSFVSSMRFESCSMYNDIPGNAEMLKSWLARRIGEDGASFFDNVRTVEVKRAFCFAFRENLAVGEFREGGNTDEDHLWTLAQRLRFLSLYATTTGSKSLYDAAVYVHEKDGNGALCPKGDMVVPFGSSVDLNVNILRCEEAGRRILVATATGMKNITPKIIGDVFNTCTPAACVELASLLGFYEMWRRMDLLFISTL